MPRGGRTENGTSEDRETYAAARRTVAPSLCRRDCLLRLRTTHRPTGWAVVAAILTAGLMALCYQAPSASAHGSASAGVSPQGCSQWSNVAVSNVVVTPQATNVTVTWQQSPTGGAATVNWGNSTARNFSQSVGAGSYSVFLDYLQTSRTYYYEIVAEAPAHSSCVRDGYYNGTWTTTSDQAYLNTWGYSFWGVVRDTNLNTAPVNLLVMAWCNNEPSVAGEGLTLSNGTYLTGVNQQICAGAHHYTVEVVNTPTGYSGGTSIQWNGHWNETINLWAPQKVNFYLDLSGLTPSTAPIVTEMQFTHTPNALVTACSNGSSEEEFQSSSSISGSLFGASYSVSSVVISSEGFGSGSCISDQGEPGSETWGEVAVAGMVVFDAVGGRMASIPWEQYYGPLQNGGNAGSGNATGAPIQDWLSEPTTLAQACTLDGINWLQWPIPAHSGTETYGMSVSGTVMDVAGETWGLSAPLELDGVSIGTFAYSSGYTITTSESHEFLAEFVLPAASVEQYFTVACSGGNPQYGYGIVLHVWQDSS